MYSQQPVPSPATQPGFSVKLSGKGRGKPQGSATVHSCLSCPPTPVTLGGGKEHKRPNFLCCPKSSLTQRHCKWKPLGSEKVSILLVRNQCSSQGACHTPAMGPSHPSVTVRTAASSELAHAKHCAKSFACMIPLNRHCCRLNAVSPQGHLLKS